MRLNIWLPALCAAAALLAETFTTAALADDELDVPLAGLPRGSAGIGAGLRRTQSPYGGRTEERDFVPLYLYDGRRFFIHGTSLGTRLAWGEDLELDFVARYRFWRIEPDRDPFFAGLDEREQSVDGGLAVRWSGDWGTFAAEWLVDLLDRHRGSELEASYSYVFRHGRWSFSPFFRLERLSGNLTSYYFGVTDAESTPERPAYSPGAALNFGYGINTAYRFGERIQVFANYGATELDQRIFASPLVRQTLLPTLFVGTSFFFGRVFEPAPNVNPERRAEWSWRVNFGYQAEGNIVGDIDQGDFRRSVDADTRIAGMTFSKLLDEGRRFDFYGRLAVHRHLERGTQDDFFSTGGYVMAVGKGYLPWSDRPAFRWGFGIGLSYAQQVPIVEQIKQERRGENKTRFLNYLEMTLDFPLANVLGPRFGECFAGLTTVHRSGVFATSNLLGDVAGGSDWITMHLECLR